MGIHRHAHSHTQMYTYVAAYYVVRTWQVAMFSVSLGPTIVHDLQARQTGHTARHCCLACSGTNFGNTRSSMTVSASCAA